MEIENPTSELRSVRSVPVCLPDGIVVGSVRFLDEIIVSRGVASDEFGNVRVGRRLDKRARPRGYVRLGPHPGL